MAFLYEDYAESAAFLKKRLGEVPCTAIVLGSGLGGLAARLEHPARVPYAQIPHFPRTTVQSHAGELLCGQLDGRPVLLLSGRFHYYEGREPDETAYYVRVLKLLGVRHLLLTNAAGAVNPSFGPGTLMLVRDHISLAALSPCRGPNDEHFGPRFFDMTNAYSPALRSLARRCAKEAGIGLFEGVYAFMCGPQYETPAEVRALGLLGADAVGMSTVPEVVEAAHCGLETLCVSCLTNAAAGITGEPLSDEEVVRTAAAAGERLGALLRLIATGLK